MLIEEIHRNFENFTKILEELQCEQLKIPIENLIKDLKKFTTNVELIENSEKITKILNDFQNDLQLFKREKDSISTNLFALSNNLEELKKSVENLELNFLKSPSKTSKFETQLSLLKNTVVNFGANRDRKHELSLSLESVGKFLKNSEDFPNISITNFHNQTQSIIESIREERFDLKILRLLKNNFKELEHNIKDLKNINCNYEDIVIISELFKNFKSIDELFDVALEVSVNVEDISEDNYVQFKNFNENLRNFSLHLKNITTNLHSSILQHLLENHYDVTNSFGKSLENILLLQPENETIEVLLNSLGLLKNTTNSIVEQAKISKIQRRRDKQILNKFEIIVKNFQKKIRALGNHEISKLSHPVSVLIEVVKDAKINITLEKEDLAGKHFENIEEFLRNINLSTENLTDSKRPKIIQKSLAELRKSFENSEKIVSEIETLKILQSPIISIKNKIDEISQIGKTEIAEKLTELEKEKTDDQEKKDEEIVEEKSEIKEDPALKIPEETEEIKLKNGEKKKNKREKDQEAKKEKIENQERVEKINDEQIENKTTAIIETEKIEIFVAEDANEKQKEIEEENKVPKIEEKINDKQSAKEIDQGDENVQQITAEPEKIMEPGEMQNKEAELEKEERKTDIIREKKVIEVREEKEIEKKEGERDIKEKEETKKEKAVIQKEKEPEIDAKEKMANDEKKIEEKYQQNEIEGMKKRKEENEDMKEKETETEKQGNQAAIKEVAVGEEKGKTEEEKNDKVKEIELKKEIVKKKEVLEVQEEDKIEVMDRKETDLDDKKKIDDLEVKDKKKLKKKDKQEDIKRGKGKEDMNKMKGVEKAEEQKEIKEEREVSCVDERGEKGKKDDIEEKELKQEEEKILEKEKVELKDRDTSKKNEIKREEIVEKDEKTIGAEKEADIKEKDDKEIKKGVMDVKEEKEVEKKIEDEENKKKNRVKEMKIKDEEKGMEKEVTEKEIKTEEKEIKTDDEIKDMKKEEKEIKREDEKKEIEKKDEEKVTEKEVKEKEIEIENDKKEIEQNDEEKKINKQTELDEKKDVVQVEEKLKEIQEKQTTVGEKHDKLEKEIKLEKQKEKNGNETKEKEVIQERKKVKKVKKEVKDKKQEQKREEEDVETKVTKEIQEEERKEQKTELYGNEIEAEKKTERMEKILKKEDEPEVKKHTKIKNEDAKPKEKEALNGTVETKIKPKGKKKNDEKIIEKVEIATEKIQNGKFIAEDIEKKEAIEEYITQIEKYDSPIRESQQIRHQENGVVREKPKKEVLEKKVKKPEINGRIDKPTGLIQEQKKSEYSLEKTEQNGTQKEIYKKSNATFTGKDTFSEIFESPTIHTTRTTKTPIFSCHLVDKEVIASSTVNLTCTVLIIDEITISWSKNNEPIENNDNYKTSFKNGIAELIIENVKPSDSAEYKCEAKNKYGSCITRSFLNVTEEKKKIRDKKVECYKNEEEVKKIPKCPVKIKREEKEEISLDSRMILSHLSDGISRLGEVSRSGNHNLSRSYDHLLESKSSDSSRLHDLSRSYDTSRLHGNRERLPDSHSSRIPDYPRHHDRLTESSIRIHEQIESFKYSKIPDTPRLNDHHHSKTLQTTSRIPEYRSPTPVSARIPPYFSRNLTDDLVPLGGVLALQVETRTPSEVTWYKESRKLHPSSQKYRTFEENGVYTLLIHNMDEYEAGKYTCRAVNKYGKSETSSYVRVVNPRDLRDGKPPLFLSRPEKMLQVCPGEDVSVSFRISGDPKPKIILMKGITDITENSRSYKETSDDYNRFTLKSLCEEDMGTYCILAKNIHGCDRAFFTLTLRIRARSHTPIRDGKFKDILDGVPFLGKNNIHDVPGPIFEKPSVTDGGKNWISLNWGKPETRAAPVIAYKIETWRQEGARWTELGISPINSFDIFNLKPGNYQFRVTPRNRYGWGETVQSDVISVGNSVKIRGFSRELPERVDALQGSDLSLECETCENLENPIWHKDNVEIERDDRTSIMQNGNVCSLKISSLTRNDAGKYVCECTNQTGNLSSSSRVFIVEESALDHDKDLPPHFTMRLRDRRVEISFPVRLTCQIIAVPTPKITWSKNGHEIEEGGRFAYWTDGNFQTLEISKTNLNDSGIYTVTAQNINGTVSCNCHLVVDGGVKAYIAPYLKVPLEPSKKLEEGAELRLVVQIEAYPVVGVIWYRNGLRLRPSRKSVMTLSYDGRVELCVANTTLKDTGNYTCIVSNEVGRVECNCKVEIVPKNEGDATESVSVKSDMYSKQPKFLKKPLSSEAYEGDTVVILCEIIGDPEPEVLWLRDFLNPDYYRDAQHFRRVNDGPEYRLEIPNAKIDFTGTYTVYAKNCHGDAKAIISLQIKVKDANEDTQGRKVVNNYQTMPCIKRNLMDIKCCDGDSVVFECEVDGSPIPDVRWEFGGKLVHLGDDFNAHLDGDIARLSIKQIYPEDEGEYTCVAYNALGRATTTARLIVDLPEEKVNILSQELKKPSNPPPLKPTLNNLNHRIRPLSSSPMRRVRATAPKFYTIPHNRVAEEGETVRFQCAVSGFPNPQTAWEKDGISLKPSRRIQISELDDLRVLELSDVTWQDGGIYKIILENEVGRMEASARLDVVMKRGSARLSARTRARSLSPRMSYGRGFVGSSSSTFLGSRLTCDIRSVPTSFLKFYSTTTPSDDEKEPQRIQILEHLPKNLETISGNSVRLSLKIDSDKGDIDVIWMKDGCVVPDCPEFRQHPPKDGVLILEIPACSALHSGRYTCEIYNPFGDVSSKCHVHVQNSGNGDVGTKCGRELKNDEKTSLTHGDGVSCLLLQNITTDDSGKYDICVENSYGSDYSFASVSVEGPPDPPSGVPSVCASSNGTTVAWSSSPYDGGKIVTGFAVEYRTIDCDLWTRIIDNCHSLSCTLDDLKKGEKYIFRVRAKNVYGYSKPSLESTVFQLDESMETSSFEPRMVSTEPGPEFRSRYEILEEIGKGRFGVVHKVIDKGTTQKLAAKFIRCRTAKDRNKVQDEIDIMNLLRHQKLLQLAAAFENPREMIMVMEYISGGELFERVVADDFTLTEKDCILFMRQICEGVAYMHSLDIVHLDLKPENIMCHTRTSHEIKIIDFGLAQKLHPDKTTRVLFGTPEFIPPEIINYEPIGLKSDIWSIGVICYVLLSGLSPFMGDNDAETFANITRAEYDFEDEAFNAVSQNARDFIAALLINKKEDRLSADQCLKHTWLDPENHQETVILSTDKLKKFIIRRKWQKTGNAIRALGRMATLSASRRNSANSTPNTPRPSLTGSTVNSMLLSRMSSLNEEKFFNDDVTSEKIDENNVEQKTNNNASVETLSNDASVETLTNSVEILTNSVETLTNSVETNDVTVEQQQNEVENREIVENSSQKSVKIRSCTERSDSGISCSSYLTSSSRTSTPLLGKKVSINEEVELRNTLGDSDESLNFNTKLGNLASKFEPKKTTPKNDDAKIVPRSKAIQLEHKIETFENGKSSSSTVGLKKTPMYSNYTTRTVASTIKKFDRLDVTQSDVQKNAKQRITIEKTAKKIDKTPEKIVKSPVRITKNSPKKVDNIEVPKQIRYRSPSPSLLRKTQAVIAKEQSNNLNKNATNKNNNAKSLIKDRQSEKFQKVAAFWKLPKT